MRLAQGCWQNARMPDVPRQGRWHFVPYACAGRTGSLALCTICLCRSHRVAGTLYHMPVWAAQGRWHFVPYACASRTGMLALVDICLCESHRDAGTLSCPPDERSQRPMLEGFSSFFGSFEEKVSQIAPKSCYKCYFTQSA